MKAGECHDVNIGRWSEEYIYSSVYNGVLTCYHDGTFRPTAPLTREEFAAAMYAHERRILQLIDRRIELAQKRKKHSIKEALRRVLLRRLTSKI